MVGGVQTLTMTTAPTLENLVSNMALSQEASEPIENKWTSEQTTFQNT